jgi:HlyD family secretion protein
MITVPLQAVTTRSADTTTTKKAGEGEETAETDPGTNEDEEDEMKEVVFVYDNGIARMRFVETGIQDVNHIVITKGVEEGEEVISGPYRVVSKTLKDGDEVQKVDKKQLYSSQD